MHPVDYSLLATLRESAILTAGYDTGTVIDVAWKYNQLLLYMDFTKGSSTSFEWIAEFSPDNLNWHQEVVESYAAGVLTTREVVHQVVSANQSAAAQLYRFAIPINDRYVRVRAKGSGVLTGSLLIIKAAMGIN
jgi:hypothetical protein